MKNLLVSEARPIPWDNLSRVEKDLIENRADKWIKAVLEDSSHRKKPAADEIDEHRTGRVLFIDGPRGAGKTSILLTLLKRWTAKTKQPGDNDCRPCNSQLHVFLPVLDFDPLPRGMPLHAWLLEPWRAAAKALEKSHRRSGDSEDLTELFVDLFERAVTGWTPAHAEGKSVVDRALQYQEHSSGWLETQEKWSKFVGAMVCCKSGCRKEECTERHGYAFVIAIDDVDLQVEHLPQLIHAIRLLHHPNVAYVLTGNYQHLQFALKLDYIRRHESVWYAHRHSEKTVDEDMWEDIKRHSDRLCEALLEKALPRHAVLSLPRFSFEDVLGVATPDGKTIKDSLATDKLNDLSDIAKSLRIVTARQTQHAIDRHLARLDSGVDKADATFDFVADLCGTTIEESREYNLKQFALRGEITTHTGPIRKVWKGDRLKIILTDQPAFAFSLNFDDTTVLDEEAAHRAVLVQLMAEKKDAPVASYNLEWTPDAGIIATHVEWDPPSKKVSKTAVFHWPWLVRPSAHQVLQFGSLSREMIKLSGGPSITDIDEKMIALWLSENIKWRLQEPKANGQSVACSDSQTERPEPAQTLADFWGRLKELWKANDKEIKDEITRWTRELYVMTAPYFGLPTESTDSKRALAQRMRSELEEFWKSVQDVDRSAISKDKIREEEKRVVGNAITAAPGASDGRKLQHPEKIVDLSEDDFKRYVEGFIKEREHRFYGTMPKTKTADGWWPWPKGKETKADGAR